MLSDVTSEQWTPEHCIQMANFVHDISQKLLIVYNDPQRGLQLMDTFPTTPVAELNYFIRTSNAVITRENFLDVVQFGTLLPDHVLCLLKIMQSMYGPTFFINDTWPESILLHKLNKSSNY